MRSQACRSATTSSTGMRFATTEAQWPAAHRNALELRETIGDRRAGYASPSSCARAWRRRSRGAQRASRSRTVTTTRRRSRETQPSVLLYDQVMRRWMPVLLVVSGCGAAPLTTKHDPSLAAGFFCSVSETNPLSSFCTVDDKPVCDGMVKDAASAGAFMSPCSRSLVASAFTDVGKAIGLGYEVTPRATAFVPGPDPSGGGEGCRRQGRLWTRDDRPLLDGAARGSAERDGEIIHLATARQAQSETHLDHHRHASRSLLHHHHIPSG